LQDGDLGPLLGGKLGPAALLERLGRFLALLLLLVAAPLAAQSPPLQVPLSGSPPPGANVP